jgi:hypothetical protein
MSGGVDDSGEAAIHDRQGRSPSTGTNRRLAQKRVRMGVLSDSG